MSEINKKTALITGASGGLGKAFCFEHAKHGGDLVIVARSERELLNIRKELEEKYKVSVKIVLKDLAIKGACEEVYEELKTQNIKIDYLINNAGFGGYGNFYERDMNLDLKMIEVNVLALTALTRLFLKDFIADHNGKILNISSIASLMPGPLQAVYYATKAYVSSFSNAVACEIKKTKVTMTTLMPGPTATGFEKTADCENSPLFKNLSSPEIVAKKGYKAMLKGKLNLKAGVKFPLKIMLPFIKFLPKKLVLNQVYKMQKKK